MGAGGVAASIAGGVAIAPCATASGSQEGQHASASTSSPGALAEGDVIYQVLVDRFADGDSANNDSGSGEFNPNDLGFYHEVTGRG